MLAAISFFLITGSVFFLTLVIFGVFSRAFERYKERYVVKSMGDLSDMFLFIDAGQILVLNICIMMLMAGIGVWIGGLLLMVLLGMVGFFVPGILIRWMRQRRIDKFNQQLVESLQQMSNALKAGLTFAQAMESVARDSRPPLSQEFGLFVKEVKLGVTQDDALLNIARRVGSEDMELVATSTTIARSLGGNMAEMFETIAGTIRERFRLEGKIKALTSQGKLQGIVVGSMPLFVGIALNMVRPDLMEPLFDHWFGLVILLGVIILEVIGALMIRKIVNIDV